MKERSIPPTDRCFFTSEFERRFTSIFCEGLACSGLRRYHPDNGNGFRSTPIPILVHHHLSHPTFIVHSFWMKLMCFGVIRVMGTLSFCKIFDRLGTYFFYIARIKCMDFCNRTTSCVTHPIDTDKDNGDHQVVSNTNIREHLLPSCFQTVARVWSQSSESTKQTTKTVFDGSAINAISS